MNLYKNFASRAINTAYAQRPRETRFMAALMIYKSPALGAIKTRKQSISHNRSISTCYQRTPGHGFILFRFKLQISWTSISLIERHRRIDTFFAVQNQSEMCYFVALHRLQQWNSLDWLFFVMQMNLLFVDGKCLGNRYFHIWPI